MKSGTPLDFDTEDLPLGDNLNSLLEMLNETAIPLYEQFKIAHLYRFHYEECKKILDAIRENNKDCDEDVNLLTQALNLQHDKEVILFDTKKHVENIFEGFISFIKKDYTKALSLFTKEKFGFGIDLCDYIFEMPRNKLLKSLVHIKNIDTKEFESSKNTLNKILSDEIFDCNVDENYKDFIKIKKKVLQDIMFCLGLLDTYNNENNNDVKHRTISDFINRGRYEEAISILENIDLSEKNYLFGKIEHLKGNYNGAKQFYKKCISEGHTNTRSFILCKYNYERIIQENPLLYSFESGPLNDLNYYLKLKNNIEIDDNEDLNGCSQDLIDFITISKGVSNNLESCVIKYDILKNNKYMDKVIFNNNLVYLRMKNKFLFVKGEKLDTDINIKEYEKMIDEAISEASENVKESLLYNQAYLKLKPSQFKKLNSEQARIMSAFLNKEDQVLQDLGLVELASCLKDNQDVFELLSSRSSLYSNLQLGKLYLDKYIKNGINIDLNFATKYFLKESKSFYAANGLGVCLALQKKYNEAIKVFNAVVIDHKPSHINLGNVYILNGDYEKAVIEFSKYQNKYSEEIIMKYKDHINVDLMINVFNKGYKGLKSVIFEKLIFDNRLDEAKNYKVTNEKLKKLFDFKIKEKKAEDDEVKRKIEELEKYKRAKNIK